MGRRGGGRHHHFRLAPLPRGGDEGQDRPTIVRTGHARGKIANPADHEIAIGRVQCRAEEHRRGQAGVVVFPGRAPVARAPHASVVSVDEAIAGPRQRVMIGVHGRARRRVGPGRRRPAVGAPPEPAFGPTGIEGVGIGGIDGDHMRVAALPRPAVAAVSGGVGRHPHPRRNRRPGIVGPKQAVERVGPPCSEDRVLHAGVQHVRRGGRDGQLNPPHGIGDCSSAPRPVDARPRVAAVDRSIEAIDDAARLLVGQVAALVADGRVLAVEVRRIDFERGGLAGEGSGPGHAAVDRLLDAEQRRPRNVVQTIPAEPGARGRRDGHVGVGRMHAHSPHGRAGEVRGAQHGPGLAAIRRLQHTDARSREPHAGGLARADIDDARVARRERDRSDGQGRGRIGDRQPRRAAVHALPDAAVADANQPVIGVGRVNRDGRDASAVEIRRVGRIVGVAEGGRPDVDPRADRGDRSGRGLVAAGKDRAVADERRADQQHQNQGQRSDIAHWRPCVSVTSVCAEPACSRPRSWLLAYGHCKLCRQTPTAV